MALGWIVFAITGAIALISIAMMGVAMTHAEIGVDPFAGLPKFDDAEAQQLLDAGA